MEGKRSSLFYNSSVRQERHERHKCDTSVIRVLQGQHEYHTSPTRMTRVKKFDLDNGTSENIFSHPYISYMANERLQGEEQFYSKNYLLEMLFPMPKYV